MGYELGRVNDGQTLSGAPSRGAGIAEQGGVETRLTKTPRSNASEAARTFEEELTRAAGSDTTVLLEGEPGSGKSTSARRVHAMSKRAHAALVVADLAALAPSLIEAELFGHLPGAYTGAREERLGRFRRADGGTLILERIESLPLEQQVKLLRVLQERRVEPLGAEVSHPIDVRLIVTSSRPLDVEVAAGRFRQDLYWRLAVVVVQVPPLRGRIDDLHGLVAELAPAAAARAGVALRPIGERALARLREHTWPGNLRELENALERVLVLGQACGPDGVPSEVQPQELDFLGEAVAGAAHRLAREALAHGLTVEELSNALLDEALREQRGNHTAAARRLGLSRRAFEYRRARHGEKSGDGEDEAP